MSAISEHNEHLRQQQPQSIPNSHFSVISSSPVRTIQHNRINHAPQLCHPLPNNHDIILSYTTDQNNHNAINNTPPPVPISIIPVVRDKTSHHEIDRPNQIPPKKYLLPQFFSRRGDNSNTIDAHTTNIQTQDIIRDPLLSTANHQSSSPTTTTAELSSSTLLSTSSSFIINQLLSSETVNQLLLVTENNITPAEVQNNESCNIHTVPHDCNTNHDDLITKERKNKRNYQQHILKKPIANDSWGSTMESADPSCTRIYFQNVNGITTTDSLTERWEDFITIMKEKGCDIFGISETNTNWKYYNIKHTAYSRNKRHCKIS